MKNQYQNLLEEILNNACELKNATTIILKSSLQNQRLRPYAQFLLYACIEECGKFLLVIDQYPAQLSEKLLKKIGFYDHIKKIKRLVENIQKYDSTIKRDNARIAKIIRENLREPSIYVNFIDGKVLPPQFVKNKMSLNSLVSLVINCIKFCEFRLEKFKKSKIN